MKSSLAKVLHPLCGIPMIDHVVQAALDAGADEAIVVVGYQGDVVSSHLQARFGERVRTALQQEQRGTGHAVLCALPTVMEHSTSALLLYGDTPLLQASDIEAMIEARGQRPLAMLSCHVPNPTGYGRLIRDEERNLVAIREHRDCTAEERRIDEINPGMYVAELGFLREALAALKPDNDQGELYLTDIVAQAASAGGTGTVEADAGRLAGINDRAQLACAEQAMYEHIADTLRRAGATIRTSARIDASVKVGRDAVIEHNVVLRGATDIAAGARIDVGCVLEDVEVAAGAYLKPYSVCAQSTVGPRAQIGPFSHLRPDTHLEEEARVGNFVETKKTRLRRGAKANHLAYLGDGDIGEKANVGAGTIFCNYDGFQKHQTVIGAGAFVGSDSQIVAPINIGAGAYVATGTTVTKDVPAEALAIARIRQENKEGYAPRLKSRLQAAAKRKKSQ